MFEVLFKLSRKSSADNDAANATCMALIDFPCFFPLLQKDTSSRASAKVSEG